MVMRRIRGRDGMEMRMREIMREKEGEDERR